MAAVKMTVETRPKVRMNLGKSIGFIRVEGSTDYNDMENKPKINGVELSGELSLEDIGVGVMTRDDIDEIFNTQEV